jgi:hypothetical protein
MTAGILQLAATGEQDTYLTGNPQVSFYRFTYRKHTNFSMETTELQFSDITNWDTLSTCTLSQKGDMISSIYLKIQLPKLTATKGNEYARWVQYIGLAMIKKVELLIGGVPFDTYPGEWLYIYNQLALDSGKRNGYDYMVGFDIDPDEPKTLYIPLTFWFTRHTGLALPIIALPFQEVKLKVHFRPFNECAINTVSEVPLESVSVLVNYVYLDTVERKYFAKEEQEYIIETIQFNDQTSTTSLNVAIDLPFVNPIKELIWVVQLSSYTSFNYKDWFNFTYSNNKNPIKNAVLQLNGVDRFSRQSGEYFNLLQPWQHHTNIPDNAGMNVYSFAINPEDAQPTGTLNFSRVDTAILKMELMDDYYEFTGEPNESALVRIYAMSYNVMGIKAGMAHIKFAA